MNAMDVAVMEGESAQKAPRKPAANTNSTLPQPLSSRVLAADTRVLAADSRPQRNVRDQKCQRRRSQAQVAENQCSKGRLQNPLPPPKGLCATLSLRPAPWGLLADQRAPQAAAPTQQHRSIVVDATVVKSGRRLGGQRMASSRGSRQVRLERWHPKGFCVSRRARKGPLSGDSQADGAHEAAAHRALP